MLLEALATGGLREARASGGLRSLKEAIATRMTMITTSQKD